MPASLWTLVAALGVVIYLLPAGVAIRRDVVARTEAVLVNLIFGWTGFGWAWALVLACGPSRPRPPQPPPTRPIPQPDPGGAVYKDGAYLVSRGPETFTWAICEAGRWTIVYEMDGADRLIGDVDERDVPFHALAEAMLSQAPVR